MNYETPYEVIDGASRFTAHAAARCRLGRRLSARYSAALWAETRLAWKVFFGTGFDTIHDCTRRT